MKDVIKKIAKDNGVTVEEVEKEMEKAISEAMTFRDRSEESKAIWKELSPDGKAPSIEDFILFCARRC